MNNRYWPVLVFIFLLCFSCRKQDGSWETEAAKTRSTAVQWLLEQQADDGGWHSETHGILKGGVAFTAYITDALVESRDSSFLQNDLDRAIVFLTNELDSSGAVGYAGKYVTEYPVYATAYTYKIFPLKSWVMDTLLAPHLLDFLLEQHFTEHRGIAPEHPAYGAWGFGELNLPQGEVGHVDLSHTRRVLEALRHHNFNPEHPCWQKVMVFLDRLQNDDGGFCSSSYTLGANKADDQNRQCVSYATTTADGLLALLSLPQPPQQKIKAAADWLIQNESWDSPSGIQAGKPGDWDKVLFFYNVSVRAQAYRKLEERGLLLHPNQLDWQHEVIAAIKEHQLADGSFSNPWGAPNKEDDPLLATALVVRALNAVLGRK